MDITKEVFRYKIRTEELRVKHRSLTPFLCLALYYNSYRYIFQINSTNTSPTYQNTPFWLSALKYLIFVLIIIYNFKLISISKVALSKRAVYTVLSFTVVSVFGLVSGISTKSTSFFEIGIFYLLPIIAVYCISFETEKELCKIYYAFSIFAVIYETVQILLFLLKGRLPALAYAGTYHIRFGGPWDDPNGFGIFISFLLPFTVLYATNRLKKIFWAVVFAGMLLLTQSMTAIAVTIGSITIVLIFCASNRSTIAKRLLYISTFIFTVLIIFFINWDVFENIVLFAKLGSIRGHLADFVKLKGLPLLTWLGIVPSPKTGEIGFVNFILMGGIVCLVCALYGIIITGSILGYRLKKSVSRETRALYTAMLAYHIAYGLSMFNLPVANIFPLNVIFLIHSVYIISAAGKENKVLRKSVYIR